MATEALKDGDVRFSRGMNSVTDPLTLSPESYAFSENMLNRGGALQTRPGYRVKLTLPTGQLQGLSVFRPRIGLPVLVAFVSGIGYTSSYPFRSYRKIDGAQMSATAQRVYTQQTMQAVEVNSDNSLRLITPRALLMVQDGINPAASFDGHLLSALVGEFATPQGTHMAWSGGRLWVARREQLFASDIANPTSFREQQFNTLGGIGYYILSGVCTGLASMPGSSPSVKTPLLAFTDSTTSMLRSNILNRSLWSQTDDFQTELFPDLGCVASRSLVTSSGMLWWFSDFGQVRLDSAQASSVSSKIDFIDREMARSAKTLHSDLSGVTSAAFENFLLTSVPHASKRNKHTWVLDSSTNDLLTEEMPPTWASVWTGVNPVEWAKLKIGGRTRLFCASQDDDGKNRIYEAFTDERRDSGCDIPWAVETRAYTGGGLTAKHLRYLEYALSELQGQVNLKISWAGADRGRWKPIASPTFLAEEGNLVAGQEITESSELFGLKKQSRLARTQDVRDLVEDDLSAAGIDGPLYRTEANKEAIDRAFQFRIEGSGPCAIRALRAFMDPEREPDSGMEDNLELADHFVRFDGAAAKTAEALQAAPETFSATKTERAEVKNVAAVASATVTSLVSQADADKRASQVARARAEARVRSLSPAYVGGSLV